MTAATGGRGREARGVGDAAPYGRVQAGIADGRVPSLRRGGREARGVGDAAPYGGRGRGARGVGDAAPYGGCGREARGVEDAAPTGGCRRRLRTAGCRPYGGKAPFCHCEPVRTLAWQSVTPVPRPLFLMFSNGNLKTPQFFIFHSSFFIFPRRGNKGAGGCMWRSMTAATADAVGRRREADGRVPFLRRVRSTSGAGGHGGRKKTSVSRLAGAWLEF